MTVNRLVAARHTVGLIKGDEKYVFVFNAADDQQYAVLLTRFCRFAEDERLSFDWKDCDRLAREAHLVRYGD